MTIQYLEKRIEELEKQVKALEQEPCDKCKYFDGNSCQHYDYKVGYTQGYEDANKRFVQEPCEDAVSRQDVLKTMCEFCPVYNCTSKCSSYKHMTDLPSVRPQEPKTGHWIRHDTGHSIYYDCSRCSCIAPCTETADAWLWKLSNYCPDCGAKMIEPQESEVAEWVK